VMRALKSTGRPDIVLRRKGDSGQWSRTTVVTLDIKSSWFAQLTEENA
jgi:hypothetical protein